MGTAGIYSRLYQSNNQAIEKLILGHGIDVVIVDLLRERELDGIKPHTCECASDPKKDKCLDKIRFHAKEQSVGGNT